MPTRTVFLYNNAKLKETIYECKLYFEKLQVIFESVSCLQFVA